MSHVAPHRWADAWQGKLDASLVEAMDAHAEKCSRCARDRARVRRASESFPSLRAQSSPELAWDSIRTRVHWSVSSEKRAANRSPSRRLMPLLAGAGVLAAAGAIVYVATREPAPVVSNVARPTPAPVVSPPPTTEPTALAAVVVRETGRDANHPFDRLVHAGDVVSTGESRLDLQFDDASALALAPSSIVSVRRFDSEQVELYLQQGTLDVTVSKRSPSQRFLITTAAGRTVEVRGTQFRVSESGSGSRVECAHGKVAVRDATGEVEVTGAHKLELGTRAPVTNVRPADMNATELKTLVDATPLTMPVWSGADQLSHTSSELEIATDASRAVRVDGLEVGSAPLRVRVMPGRHTVETADRAGRFRRAGWVDAAAGKPAKLDVRDDDVDTTARASAGIVTRKNQLHAGIDKKRLASCTRAIAKSGLTDTYVRFEISVDETGAVQFLNILDTDLPAATAGCVREALTDVRFVAGPTATFQDRVDL